MKVGIDSYCYHRYFGEIYPEQTDPGVRWTFQDFVRRAVELGVAGVSLESCFFDSLEPGYLSEIKAVLDENSLERVLAWGHPDGLEAGRSEKAWREMNSLIPKARFMGADIMRIVASSLMFRNEPHAPQIEAIVKMLKTSVQIAADNGVILALENHIDYTSAEIQEILERVGSDALKVNFDTGNTLRMMEDPVAAARRLGPFTVATHTKDLDACRHVRPEEWYFFSSVPVGTGLIDMRGVVLALKECGYQGVLAVESDHHKDNQDEDQLVAASVAYLKQLLAELEG
ncbi:MAG: sugar phosphate isomerase/epimerase [Planctomycetaceae bacterium]|mgnify:CR=1 FL=1|nr:sugar phosphate isomerase/epimerase [Planctomycetaceae bacterium]